MALNRFNILVFVQIILIALVALLITISFGREYLHMTTAGLIIIWVGQILFLNFHMNRIHRDVRKFMDALRNQDTSQLFNDRKDRGYFGKLYRSFNEITRNFRLVRIEKEVENQFYRVSIKQAASGIMAVAEDQHVNLVNDAALQIFGMDKLNHLSELRKIHPEFVDLVATGDIGNHQVKVLVNRKMVQLAVKLTEMNLEGKAVKIYSLLDISSEMDRNEVKAWQKLIRVLNHEITNSVAPLHILSTSLFDLFHEGERQKSAKELDDDLINRTVLGLKTIIKRSGGLNSFINTYSSFTDAGEPEYSSIQIDEMFDHVISLLGEEFTRSGIEIRTDIVPPDLQLQADEKLIEQTLINLVKNSIFALENRDRPVIHLNASQHDKQVSIEVKDNGKGISADILDTIFTPFFTTRKGGSGIGLSLARQVMLMHNGRIHVTSKEGEQTLFTLTF
jgi:nitrogen fixation/metabolism regulation signal transduction histidine kinase